MRIIFLDMDGVLCTMRAHIAQNGFGLMEKLDREAIGLLNRAASDDVRYVLSSTWRKFHDQPWMEHHLQSFGWTGQFHDDWKTGDINGPRGLEIAEWLGRHPEIEDYAIIDDDSDFLPDQLPRHVHTACYDGLSWQNFLDLNRILYGFEDAWVASNRARFNYEYDAQEAP